MALEMISLVPGVHASLIGILGSVFGAYSVYAIQQRHALEAKSKKILDDLCKITTELDVTGGVSVFNDVGNFDRDRYFSLRSKVVGRGSASGSELSQFFDFRDLINQVFLKYRFSDSQNTKGLGVVFVLGRRDIKHCEDFIEILTSLNEFFRRNSEKVMQAAAKADVLSRKNAVEKLEVDCQRWGADDATLHEHRAQLEIFGAGCGVQSLLNMLVKQMRLIKEYLFLAGKYKSSLNEELLWSERLPVEKYLKLIIPVVAGILFAGIVLPFVLVVLFNAKIQACERFGLCWSPYFEFALLILGVAPYFILLLYLWCKLRKSKPF